MLRHFTKDDIAALLDIYNYYVTNTVATFDIKPLKLQTFEKKLNDINSKYPFLIFEEEKQILGFAYASKFRPKPAYKFTVEATVYVKHTAHGKHIGSQLYKALIHELKQTDTHTILGVLTLPNEASIKLHQKFGFEEVAHLKELGYKFGAWHNVAIYQLRLT